MNIWTKRLLILLSIGGGFAGVNFMLALISRQNVGVAHVLLIVAMIATYGFGIFAGFRLIEDEAKGLRLLRWFFVLQIPIISSAPFSYQLTCGFGAGLTWIANQVSFFWRFGSEMGVLISSGRPWGIGVNLFALAMFIWTGRIMARRSNLDQPSAPMATTITTSGPPQG
jgi:hypothetical protein